MSTMWIDRNYLAEIWQDKYLKMTDKGHEQDYAIERANKLRKRYEKMYWYKVGNYVKIEVKDEFKKYYTNDVKVGEIASITDEHILIISGRGNPDRYVIGTFTIMEVLIERYW
jgi:hypothetical protein